MVKGLQSVCAPLAPRVGLVCVGVWNHSRQTSSSPPWSIAGQWIIAIYTFPIKSTCCQSISGTAWNSYRRKNTIPNQKKVDVLSISCKTNTWQTECPDSNHRLKTLALPPTHTHTHGHAHTPLLIYHLLKFSAFTAATAVCLVILASLKPTPS